MSAPPSAVATTQAQQQTHPAYKPMRGRLIESKVIEAREEYERRAANGEQDIRLMVVTEMSARRWENSTVKIRKNGCQVDVTYSADGTLVDIELVEVDSGRGHARAFAYAADQLSSYVHSNINGRELYASDGPVKFTRADGRMIEKDPDCEIGPLPRFIAGDSNPRLITEVCVNAWTLESAQREYQVYFEGPLTLRAVVVLKFFPVQADGTIASVAVVYRRSERDSVVVDDVVSFGSAPLSRDDELVLAKIDPTRRLDPLKTYRDLSGGPSGDLDAPAELRIPATDLYYGTKMVGFDGALLQPRPDLVIELRIIFSEFSDCIPSQHV